MTNKSNLTDTQWAEVLLTGSTPEAAASQLLKGERSPWTDILLRYIAESETILDLGSGKGDHCALLALNGRRTTLLDWSKENLDFSSRLFEAVGIRGEFCHADMTKPLPFPSNSFHTVFSCGVFEHFTGKTVENILGEALRVSKKRVIIMVPNALSIAYRIGKWYMETTEQWPWGREVPAYTLKPYFRCHPNVRVSEFSVAAKHSLEFLTMPGGDRIKTLCIRAFNLTGHSRPSRFRQGYLLITIAEKAS